ATKLIALYMTWAVSVTALAEEPPGPLCLAPARAEAVRAAWSDAPGRLLEVAQREAITEAQLLSVLPPEQSIGTGGEAFGTVWQSLQAWPESLTLIERSGQLFEVLGRIPSGEPSKVSRFFNLGDQSHGLSGHLRPDLVTAIYVTELPGRGRTEHGVQFIDAAGGVVFGVYVPNEQAAAGNETLAAFRATRKLVEELPRLCP
ncbi:MAG: ChuX/HutX family heme-like substrate-binding protein, partial [Steroidobacteraceae bacterium]